MNILKQGISPKRLLKGKCTECKTVLTCNESEATWLSDGADDSSACFGIICPTCVDWIYLRQHKTKK